MLDKIKQWNAYRSGTIDTPDLSGADLSGADLSGADLYGADLSGADLSGADLYGKIILRLPVGDPRGYDCVAVLQGEQWQIFAGCRAYFIDEAKAHWGAAYTKDREIGDRYLYAIGFLEAHIARNKGE